MANIQFDEGQSDQVLYTRIQRTTEAPAMVRFLLKKGWVKTERAAVQVLLIGAVAVFVISIFFWISAFGGNSPAPAFDPEFEESALSAE